MFLFAESFLCNIVFQIRNRYSKGRSLPFSQTVLFKQWLWFSNKRNRKITNLSLNLCQPTQRELKMSSNLPTMTKRAKWKTNMKKFSIHGEKIRFHISQREFLNYYGSQFFHFHQKTQYRISLPIYWVAHTIERKFVFIPDFDKNSRKFS